VLALHLLASGCGSSPCLAAGDCGAILCSRESGRLSAGELQAVLAGVVALDDDAERELAELPN
jgi:hypothetical protein